jgi:non-canonical (house-cleaning) NTP pyrophosphatase
MLTKYPLKKLALGSTSPLKVEAVQRALALIHMADTEVIPIDAPSNVDAQPIGPDVAALGAENRARQALARTYGDDDTNYGVGIENGLELRRGVWLDVATVAVVTFNAPGGQLVALATSVGLPIPSEYVEQAIRRGIRDTTAGFMYAKATGGSANDWHTELTKGRFSRVRQMTEAVYAALIQLAED